MKSTAVATIARIPYLNSAPFYARWDEAPGTSVDLPPRALGEEARAGRADAGLMAAADWFALAPVFERVGALGITCRGAVGSVLLLSRKPVRSLGGATVDLTQHSMTSVALTRVLLGARYGLDGVRYVRRAVEAGEAPQGDAWLLIGDAALAARKEAAGLHVLDLGEEWLAWTGLPFVYAVWAVRASLPSDEKARLAAFLESSLTAGEASIDDLARRAAEAQPHLGTPEELAAYLRGFRYRLGEDEEAGLARFRALWKEYRLDA
jgi:chorismate dehydratase